MCAPDDIASVGFAYGDGAVIEGGGAIHAGVSYAKGASSSAMSLELMASIVTVKMDVKLRSGDIEVLSPLRAGFGEPRVSNTQPPATADTKHLEMRLGLIEWDISSLPKKDCSRPSYRRTTALVPTKRTVQKRAVPQSFPARSTVYVAAEKDADGICTIVQLPTLASIKDALAEELPGAIALFAIPRTPVHWAQLCAKGARTAHAYAKAHLAGLHKEQDLEEQKRRVIARVEAERATRWNLPFPVRRESPTKRHERMQRALLEEPLPAYKLSTARFLVEIAGRLERVTGS
ncbi:hypothetical protein BOTBODRAFT_177746 [Botryobasidium botryosum FD-172 SS1]|uniref:Uncharacterized protein n=1 Tax=Botryobasidium botryosum (strain FD-172 SS1) TaxID=930990 RepID=A0A067MH40_BOTB1|nr:hypothetical protein BOTBODRAFT_177746 [Botryobasidium botryosum FD-172 SS1]